MNSIMACDEVREESEFLSALNASLQNFVHKTLKDEKIECIFRMGCAANATSKANAELFCWLTKWNGTVTK